MQFFILEFQGVFTCCPPDGAKCSMSRRKISVYSIYLNEEIFAFGDYLNLEAIKYGTDTARKIYTD